MPVAPDPRQRYRLTLGDRYEIAGKDGCRRSGSCSAGGDAHVRIRTKRVAEHPATGIEEARGYEHDGTVCGARATSAWPVEAGTAAALVASTEPWDTMLAMTPGRGAWAPNTSGAGGCCAWRRPWRARALPRSWCWPPISSSSPRRAGIDDAARATRGRRRGAHRDRRLPLVHRLGPRHHDQPRRADAHDRPACERPASILRTFAHYVRDGLIPNLFPEGSNEGLYHTADATLWFFHAARPLRRHRPATAPRSSYSCRC